MNRKQQCIAESRAILKRVIMELEDALGIEAALPVTMNVLRAIEALDQLETEASGRDGD